MTTVWVGVDTEKLGRLQAGSEAVEQEKLFASKTLGVVLDRVVGRPGHLMGTKVTKHYHNYTKIETWG